MKKTVWIVIFLVILIADLLSVYLEKESARFATKLLLMPALVMYFWGQTKSIRSDLKAWILIALFFSWAGDILLMFETKKSIFFLLGLSAFFVTQVFYIIFFHNIRMREYIRGNALLLLLAIVYYSILMSILSPFLGQLKLPVRIYGVVLSFMLMLAMHTMFSKNKKAGAWMMVGAILFVISDSLLAFNKFYVAFNYAGVLTMLTYGVAQLFITHGAVKYISQKLNDDTGHMPPKEKKTYSAGSKVK
jgi:uncharacterized membrane protein YhhN